MEAKGPIRAIHSTLLWSHLILSIEVIPRLRLYQVEVLLLDYETLHSWIKMSQAGGNETVGNNG
jgi:uncharacterized membrane protein YozB (DUF420 family)